MEGYDQYCPLAKGAEVFAERWTPLILRELLRGSTRSMICIGACRGCRGRSSAVA
jgi:hypothetical protein